MFLSMAEQMQNLSREELRDILKEFAQENEEAYEILKELVEEASY